MAGADKTTRATVPQWASPPPPPPPYTSTENLASEPITQQPSSSDQSAVFHEEFKYSLCSCLDDIPAVGVSISALYCPCWSYFMTQRHLEREKGLSATGACSFFFAGVCAPFCLGGSYFAGGAVLAGLMQIFGCLFCIMPYSIVCEQREQIRKKFGMPQKYCDDFWLSFCCTCCVMVQNERQVRSAAGELY